MDIMKKIGNFFFNLSNYYTDFKMSQNKTKVIHGLVFLFRVIIFHQKVPKHLLGGPQGAGGQSWMELNGKIILPSHNQNLEKPLEKIFLHGEDKEWCAYKLYCYKTIYLLSLPTMQVWVRWAKLQDSKRAARMQEFIFSWDTFEEWSHQLLSPNQSQSFEFWAKNY